MLLFIKKNLRGFTKKGILTATILLISHLTLLGQATSQKGDYASLAIDHRNGDQYGWAINHTSREAADARALQECQENGGDCHVVLRFQGGCGVYVVERGNPSLYGWGTADSREAAEARAMEEARARGGKDLVVRVWGCNEGTLKAAEESSAPVKGVYSFHMIYSEDENKLFITKALYQPGVAQKSGDSWVWTPDAEEKMKPRAQKFMDFVVEDLYGYLGEYKDEAITSVKVDWKGKNELDLANALINESNSVRLEKMEKAVEGVHQMARDEGAEIIVVDVE